MKNVVVIGGGHGQSVILRGLKEIENINLTAIVTISDDGGSTGRLRDHFNVPAVGDIRNVMLALSNDKNLIYDLMDYRFSGDSEEDVEGHNLGNLMLTALLEKGDTLEESINELSKYLKIKGDVVPVSNEVVTLYATMEDDSIVRGEKNIPSKNNHIEKVYYDHDVKANKKAINAILNADLIIYGIGSLFTSILPIVIIKEINEALHNTKARRIYMANCMTQNNETFDFDLKKHEDALLKHNTPIDEIIISNNVIPNNIKEKYAAQECYEVIDNGDTQAKVIKKDLLDFSSGLVRHSSEKIKRVIEEEL